MSKRRGRRAGPTPAWPSEEWKKEIDRINALDRIRMPPLPEPPAAEVYGKELELACVSLKAIADTLKLASVGANKEADFLAAAANISSPFRALIICGAEHCRGQEAAIVAKSSSCGDNLYWMGGRLFRAVNPNSLAHEPYLTAEGTIRAGWHALDVVVELLTRLENGAAAYKNAAGAAPSLTNTLIR